MKLKRTLQGLVRPPLIVLKNATRDLEFFVNTRQGFAEDMRTARRSIIPDGYFGTVRTIATIGGGHLENPYFLAMDLGAKEIIAFDPVAKPARYIEKKITVHFFNKKFEDVDKENIKRLLKIDFVWELSNVLQTMKMTEKEILLKKIWELSNPGQYVVVVDEELSDNTTDSILNTVFNPEQEIFDRLTFEGYTALFERTGYKIITYKRNYHRDLDLMILQVVK